MPSLCSCSMSAGKLQACLSSSAKASWAARSVKESVVLMDWNSKDAHPTGNAAIYTLLDILKNVRKFIFLFYSPPTGIIGSDHYVVENRVSV